MKPGATTSPPDIDGRRAPETVSDRGDRVTIDPDVAHAVEPGLGIHDPTTEQHQVVGHRVTSFDRTSQPERQSLVDRC